MKGRKIFFKGKCFLCTGFLWMCFSSAEGQVIKFQRTYGGINDDYGRSVEQTFDKGYIIAGATSSFGSGATDVYLIKTDSLGNMKWSKTFGGANVDWGYSVQQTTDSGFVIAGFTNSFGNGGYDVYLVKTDSIGDTLWTKTYGGSNWDFGYSVRQTTDGGYIITGGTYSFGNGDEDFYLIKTNSAGDTLWTKTFGGIAEDEARSVWENTDGTYVLAGYTESFDDKGSDYYYLKVDQNGNAIWAKTLGGSGGEGAYSITQTLIDGGFIIGGYTNSFGVQSSNDFYLVKTNSTGDTIWTLTVGAWDNEIGYSACTTLTGGYVIIGLTEGPGYHHIFFHETDANSNWVATATMGTTGEDAFYIQSTADTGFIIVGDTKTMGLGMTDVYLIKTSNNGSTNPYNSVEEVFTYYDQVTIYPNPFSNTSSVEISYAIINEKKILAFSIYDVTGRKVKSYPITEMHSMINREGLEHGIYIFRLEENNGQSLYGNGKLVIH